MLFSELALEAVDGVSTGFEGVAGALAEVLVVLLCAMVDDVKRSPVSCWMGEGKRVCLFPTFVEFYVIALYAPH